MEAAARRFPAGAARLVFKKIDSTWRGNVAMEVALVREAFGCEFALITPAFPAMGRTVEKGILRVANSEFTPVDLTESWRKQDLPGCVQMFPGEVPLAILAGERFISADASSDRDLDLVVAAGLASGGRVLWTGSAGLASALARALPRGAQPDSGREERTAAVLFYPRA